MQEEFFIHSQGEMPDSVLGAPFQDKLNVVDPDEGEEQSLLAQALLDIDRQSALLTQERKKTAARHKELWSLFARGYSQHSDLDQRLSASFALMADIDKRSADLFAERLRLSGMTVESYREQRVNDLRNRISVLKDQILDNEEGGLNPPDFESRKELESYEADLDQII